MYTIKTVSTDSFLLFQILNEKGHAVDSVTINKYSDKDVLFFYNSDDEYIEKYTAKLKALTDAYEEKLDFDEAQQSRSEAEFILYKNVKGL